MTDECKIQVCRDYISKHLRAKDVIEINLTIYTDEDQGLSDNEKIVIKVIGQEPCTGEIVIWTEGGPEEGYDLDGYPLTVFEQIAQWFYDYDEW